MAAMHPALAPSAGLTSGLAHIAVRRWDPVKESSDYAEHFEDRHVKNQVPLPVHTLSMAYSNLDIEFSQPTSRAILACNGLPRNFKTGSRCVNPLEPRYILPGCSASAAATPISETPRAVSPTDRRPGSERLLVSALSMPRGDGAGASASPKLQPLPHSPSGSHTVFSSSSGQPYQRQQQQPQQPQQQQQAANLGPNSNVNVNGAVGGLLLYGPTAFSSPVAAAAVTTVTAAAPANRSPANRCLDVADINGQRRSVSVPMRRNGAFDPLSVTDIVPPRHPSPTRPLACLTTSDIAGAAPRQRTRDVPSPGHGTLSSADIAGAAPGCLTRPSPTTYALGRWPAPAVPQFHFAHSTRVTMMKKPVTIGE